jgi:hypothetical protein
VLNLDPIVRTVEPILHKDTFFPFCGDGVLEMQLIRHLESKKFRIVLLAVTLLVWKGYKV